MVNEEEVLVPMSDTDLASWDWKGALKAEERSLEWLARRTDRSLSAVNKYSAGNRAAPVDWLRLAARVLGKAA